MNNWWPKEGRGKVFGFWTCHQYVGDIVAAFAGEFWGGPDKQDCPGRALARVRSLRLRREGGSHPPTQPNPIPRPQAPPSSRAA